MRTGYVGKDAAQGSRIGELRAYDGVDGADGCPEAGSALHAFILIDGGMSAVGSGDDGSDGAVGAALPAADAVRGNEHFGVSAKGSEGRNDGALEFVKNELLHFRTLESGLKRFEDGLVFVFGADDEDVGKIGFSVFEKEGIFRGRKIRFDCPGTVDDGKAYVGERPPEVRAVHFAELEMLRVRDDVARRSVYVGTRTQGDEAVAFKKLQRPTEVGGISGDGDEHAVGNFIDAVNFQRIDAQREEYGFTERREGITLLRNGFVKVRDVLESIDVDILGGKRFINVAVVGKFHDLDFETLGRGDFGRDFRHFGVRAGQSAEFDFCFGFLVVAAGEGESG